MYTQRDHYQIIYQDGAWDRKTNFIRIVESVAEDC